MKKIYRVLGLSVFLFALSCDLEKDLDNPNEVSVDTADPTLIMNGIQADFGQWFSLAGGQNIAGTNDFANSRSVAELVRMQAMTGGDQYERAFTPQDLNAIWSGAYQDVLINIEAMLPLAEEDNLTTHIGVAKIIKAYIFMTLVDLFGDVPADEALKGGEGIINPSTTPGSAVYDMALTLLNEARTELAKPAAEAGPALTRDIFYGGNRTRWITLANTLEFKAWLNISALPARATEAGAALSALLTANDLIDTDAEEFTYKYGTADVPTRSRHPLYLDYYRAQSGSAGGYIGNYFLKQVFNGTGVQDPRWRYYFYRQAGSILRMLAFDGESVPCVNTAGKPIGKPAHFSNDHPFCVFDPGFFGRDHGDNDGGPPDSPVITTVGVYPAAGRIDNQIADANDPVGGQFVASTQQGQGGNGRGIEPIFMSFFINFMRAEAILRGVLPGDAAAARAQMISGIDKSITRVQAFGSSLGQTTTLATPALTYTTKVGQIYDLATDKLDVVGTEFYKALWGNPIEAYNLLRRTSSPRTIQPTRAINGGVFFRSLLYPANFVNLNNSTAQKPVNDVRVFWDGNPDNLF